MRRLIASVLTALTLSTGITLGTAGTAGARTLDYRAQVIAQTISYGPCKRMIRSKAGRIMYRDMISDTYDDGHKRSLKAQVTYVRQGCRNGI